MPIEEQRVETAAPPRRKSIWLQVLFVFLLAAFVQAIGLVFAYVARCKPGQGNDFCGAGSLAGMLFGFVAAVIVLGAGLVIVFLRRNKVAGERGPGPGRLVAAVAGAIVLVPCSWMVVVGWPRNNSNAALWLGAALGIALILAAVLLKRANPKDDSIQQQQG